MNDMYSGRGRYVRRQKRLKKKEAKEFKSFCKDLDHIPVDPALKSVNEISFSDLCGQIKRYNDLFCKDSKHKMYVKDTLRDPKGPNENGRYQVLYRGHYLLDDGEGSCVASDSPGYLSRELDRFAEHGMIPGAMKRCDREIEDVSYFKKHGCYPQHKTSSHFHVGFDPGLDDDD